MDSDTRLIKEKIRSNIQQAAYVDIDILQYDSFIFREGYLDSMGFIRLIAFIEEEFGIKTNNGDLIEENFETINAIADFVIRKTNNK